MRGLAAAWFVILFKFIMRDELGVERGLRRPYADLSKNGASGPPCCETRPSGFRRVSRRCWEVLKKLD